MGGWSQRKLYVPGIPYRSNYTTGPSFSVRVLDLKGPVVRVSGSLICRGMHCVTIGHDCHVIMAGKALQGLHPREDIIGSERQERAHAWLRQHAAESPGLRATDTPIYSAHYRLRAGAIRYIMACRALRGGVPTVYNAYVDEPAPAWLLVWNKFPSPMTGQDESPKATLSATSSLLQRWWDVMSLMVGHEDRR